MTPLPSPLHEVADLSKGGKRRVIIKIISIVGRYSEGVAWMDKNESSTRI